MDYKWDIEDISVSALIRTVFALVIGFFLLRFYLKRRQFVAEVNKLPSLKLRWYHILGHAHFAVYMRIFMKMPLRNHIYDFIGLSGSCFLHTKEGIANLWAGVFNITFAFKADSVEVILNHSTQLEKAWLYKFTYPWLGRGLLTSSGSKWRSRRKLLTPAFHFSILHDFLPVLNSKARVFAEVLKSHAGDEFVNIVPYVTRCSLDVLCDTVLGVDLDVQNKPTLPYVQSVNFLTEAIAERFFNFLIWPDFAFRISRAGRNFASHVKLVHDFTLKIIREKKSKIEKEQKGSVYGVHLNPDDSPYRKKRALMDLLLDEHVNNNSLTEKDIVEEVDTFTFEGHDTTAMGMSFALYLIGLHKGHQEKIHEELDAIFGTDDRDVTMDDLKEMKYLERVIKESLRLFPPVPFFGRLLTEDLEIDGKMTRKGSMIMAYAYMLHRDPEIFPNPEKFDPDRFTPENCRGRHPFAYVPFSAGPRNCIGQRFALMEEKIVLSALLRRYKIRSLDPRDRVHLMNELVLRPVGGLRLEIRHRGYVPEKPWIYFHNP